MVYGVVFLPLEMTELCFDSVETEHVTQIENSRCKSRCGRENENAEEFER